MISSREFLFAISTEKLFGEIFIKPLSSKISSCKKSESTEKVYVSHEDSPRIFFISPSTTIFPSRIIAIFLQRISTSSK